jgi:foldase protein PrsA
VRVKSIVVRTKEEANEIVKALSDGVEFESLATKRSIHPSAAAAGEIGWFGKGEKDPALEKIAFSLEKGQISDIIKTEAGYEIIKLVNKKGGQVRPLEEIKELVRMRLTKQKFDQEKQRYYEKAGVKILGT